MLYTKMHCTQRYFLIQLYNKKKINTNSILSYRKQFTDSLTMVLSIIKCIKILQKKDQNSPQTIPYEIYPWSFILLQDSLNLFSLDNHAKKKSKF